MGNYCEQVVHSRYLQLGLQPTTGQRSPSPPGGRDRRAGHPRSGHMKVGCFPWCLWTSPWLPLCLGPLCHSLEARTSVFCAILWDYVFSEGSGSEGRKEMRTSANQNAAGPIEQRHTHFILAAKDKRRCRQRAASPHARGQCAACLL